MIHAKSLINNKLFKDIRFWIILFFVIRLFGITNPPLEVAHNWRQTTVTMVARNFYETGPDLFYPRVDFAGEKSGITGMEFPLLNYLIYLVSIVFGYCHWYGRIINLLVSSIGIFYFFRIISKYFNGETAFYSTQVLLSSIWFAYSRKIMPDTFSMSLVITGFYYGTQFFDNSKNRFLSLFLYFILMLLGILSKIPSGFILILFLLFLIDKKTDLKPKLIFSVTTLLLLIPVYEWYFWWNPYLVKEYGFWHFFMGKSVMEGGNEILRNLQDTLAHFYDYALKFIGFFVFVYGIVLSVIHRNKLMLLVLLLSFTAFSIIILKSGFTFAHHAYYIIPFVPVMALLCGYAFSLIANYRIRFVLILAIVLEGILNQQHDFFIRPQEKAILTLENTLDTFAKRSDLILINSGNYPTAMYFAHHKGWISSNQQISDEQYISTLKTKGCKYIVILKQSFGTDMPLRYTKVYNDEHYSVYKLN